MRTALILLELWVLAFVTLAFAVLLLNIFWNLIDQDLELRTLGQEATIAAIAAFVEVLGLRTVAHLGPGGGLAILAIAVVVALIYKVAHLEDWHRYEIVCLLLFQSVFSAVGASVAIGHFLMAACVLAIILATLGVVAVFLKSW